MLLRERERLCGCNELHKNYEVQIERTPRNFQRDTILQSSHSMPLYCVLRFTVNLQLNKQA